MPFRSMLSGARCQVTTGRNLRVSGWPENADRVAVMLDGQADFTRLDPDGIYVWWGAYLGMECQILRHGRLGKVAEQIVTLREHARAQQGWIMDCCLLQRRVE